MEPTGATHQQTSASTLSRHTGVRGATEANLPLTDGSTSSTARRHMIRPKFPLTSSGFFGDPYIRNRRSVFEYILGGLQASKLLGGQNCTPNYRQTRPYVLPDASAEADSVISFSRLLLFAYAGAASSTPFLLHRNGVPLIHILCMITASRRATATCPVSLPPASCSLPPSGAERQGRPPVARQLPDRCASPAPVSRPPDQHARTRVRFAPATRRSSPAQIRPDPPFTTRRLSSTTQNDVSFNEASRLTECFMAILHRVAARADRVIRSASAWRIIPPDRHRRGGCAKQPDCPISAEWRNPNLLTLPVIDHAAGTPFRPLQ